MIDSCQSGWCPCGFARSLQQGKSLLLPDPAGVGDGQHPWGPGGGPPPPLPCSGQPQNPAETEGSGLLRWGGGCWQCSAGGRRLRCAQLCPRSPGSSGPVPAAWAEVLGGGVGWNTTHTQSLAPRPPPCLQTHHLCWGQRWVWLGGRGGPDPAPAVPPGGCGVHTCVPQGQKAPRGARPSPPPTMICLEKRSETASASQGGGLAFPSGFSLPSLPAEGGSGPTLGLAPCWLPALGDVVGAPAR